jgi:FRG domain
MSLIGPISPLRSLSGGVDKMNGQWFGNYTGSTDGMIIMNVDERENKYQGVAYLLPNDYNNLPGTAAFFETANKDTSRFEFRTNSIFPIDPSTYSNGLWDKVKTHFPQVTGFSKHADVVGSLDGEFLRLSWKTELDATGQCALPRSRADAPSDLIAMDKDWAGFKEYVATLKGRRFLFRGQERPWRLRTSFHRTGRADLNRFLNSDIISLRNHLSVRTKHLFHLDVADELGAFFNLVQHHGYPTPLLDWTYSPYVAAFFAYRRAVKTDTQRSSKVRIHVFDQVLWRSDQQQILLLLFPGLHVSIGEFISIENERMIPQQSVSTLSNIDDIESYVKSKESESKRYLSAIDLPIEDRDQVMRDLSYMGITAGSLFPGLDGACEELRERNFGD